MSNASPTTRTMEEEWASFLAPQRDPTTAGVNHAEPAFLGLVTNIE